MLDAGIQNHQIYRTPTVVITQSFVKIYNSPRVSTHYHPQTKHVKSVAGVENVLYELRIKVMEFGTSNRLAL